jgi:hypothetical protein
MRRRSQTAWERASLRELRSEALEQIDTYKETCPNVIC